MARIAIIVGHARKGSYCEALGQAYWRGARAVGHDATLVVRSSWLEMRRSVGSECAESGCHDTDGLCCLGHLWKSTIHLVFP
jgi:hypothetical protein